MNIPHVLSIQSELPVRIARHRLNKEKAEMFNNGDFARTNYKYLYVLTIDKGKGKTLHHLASPSLKQTLWSIPALWRAKDGDPYDRHGHPVVMQSFDIEREEDGEKAES